MIPIHATATSDPAQLRWVVPDRLPARGTVRRAPGRLGAMLGSGTVAEIVVGADDILITLGVGNSWRELGDDVREALGEALVDPRAGRSMNHPARIWKALRRNCLRDPLGRLPPRTAGRSSSSRSPATP